MGYLVVYGAGFLLPQVGGFQVGQMQLDGDGVFIVGHAYGKIPAPCSVIKATHVPADRRGFGRLQSHKALDEEHAFFTVAVRESVLDGVVGHLFPLAGFFILHIAGAYFVELCLAHIMQQGAQRKAFGAIGFGVKVLFHHHLVDINAVLHQAAGAGAVIAGAGPALLAECKTLGGCPTGESKITDAYNLPCRKVIHTVGPVWHGGTHGEAEKLASCYHTSFILARENGIQSIAFPCISTGVYHYPKEEAARIALNAIGEEMAHGYEGEVIVCCFSEEDAEVYRKLLSC